MARDERARRLRVRHTGRRPDAPLPRASRRGAARAARPPRAGVATRRASPSRRRADRMAQPVGQAVNGVTTHFQTGWRLADLDLRARRHDHREAVDHAAPAEHGARDLHRDAGCEADSGSGFARTFTRGRTKRRLTTRSRHRRCWWRAADISRRRSTRRFRHSCSRLRDHESSFTLHPEVTKDVPYLLEQQRGIRVGRRHLEPGLFQARSGRRRTSDLHRLDSERSRSRCACHRRGAEHGDESAIASARSPPAP